MESEEAITLKLSKAHALVLYSYLGRSSEKGGASFEDPAEQRALWDLECILESKLEDVLASDYQARLANALKEIRGAPET